MRAWQIIVASAVVASIAAAALFLPGAVRFPGGAVSLVQTYWPGVTIVWLCAYSIVALGLSTAAAFRELGDAASGQAGLDWPRRYLLRLGITQYFSAVLVLLALGLLPVAIATEPFFSMPAAIGSSPALAACAVAILVGVLGWLTATVVAAFRTPPVGTATPAGLDTQLLQEIVEPAARPPDRAGLGCRGTRRTAPATRSRDIGGDQGTGRGDRPSAQRHFRNSARFCSSAGRNRQEQSGSAALADVAEAAGELRAATAALTGCRGETRGYRCGAGRALPAIGVSLPARGSVPPGSRSQLSTELQELLRDMAAGPASRQEGSR